MTRPTPTGSRGCVCAACERSFSSPSAFDRHQRYSADTGTVCLHPAEVGLEAREKGGTTVWGGPAWDPSKKAMPWGSAA
ncbi:MULTISPECIES: hypothetical protein [unclassified Nocardiopsis]|uniref:FDXHR family putative zinc-binding protein n=1 Tax=Nocardiopsis TaxID=2013 RepID=UPI00387B951C